MTLFLETDIFQFFGRFHAMLVHLPIGFIVIAVFFELIALKKKVDLNLAIRYSFLLGAIFGSLSIILGLMLASDGGYNEDTLSTHKWTGIIMIILTFVLFLIKRKQSKAVWMKKSYPVIVTVVMILLFVAGHNGGNLTHGSNYLLEYAPSSIRSMAGMKPARERVTDLDSALVYEDVIHPIFESKCNVCHNNDKAKGELLLISPESILKGGENGEVIASGDAPKSELYRRITLDPNHKEFMPTEGRTPLTNEETVLIEWWINEGAHFDKKIIELNLTDRIKSYLQEVGIGLKKTFLESLNLTKVSPQIIDSIKQQGFKIKPIINESALLETRYSSYNKHPLSEKKLDVLLSVKDNVTWLTLANIDVKDELTSKISQFKNLTELRINNANLSDNGLEHLAELKNLEYLNIYGNPITDASIKNLQKLKSLKKLYIWKTNISEEGVKRIKDTLPELTIVSGE
ncbi:hypothetical protein L3X37_03760 [Sabulilitoribacter arenilitoris]|uniref:Cytochrome c domain-containing protein n=1 Tax=Wocania arenilitoris TaxID=2044858 RepID=A0AAE3EN22_9FLAO|nr:DUF2231 domain-containing protein [Wocania arenilitoris]MCF7567482.1 hypothetical protein [Wocania arenilitoris]